MTLSKSNDDTGFEKGKPLPNHTPGDWKVIKGAAEGDDMRCAVVVERGRLMFSIQGAFDQFERDKTQERTLDGMAELRRRGVKLGRAKLFDEKQTAAIKRDRKTMTREEAADKWKCSPGTIDKYAA